MVNDDDTFHQEQCGEDVYHHSGTVFQERSTLLMGLGRLFAFLCIMWLHRHNRRLLRDKEEFNVNVVPGLVLPYYFAFIYLYISISLFMGLIDVAVSTRDEGTSGPQYNWLIPVEQAMFHWFYEGLSFFLMRYGAGVRAIKRSLLLSGAWSVCTFVTYFFIFCTLKGTFGMRVNPDTAYALIVFYMSVLFVFYTCALVVPKSMLFRRSAMRFYAAFNAGYYLVSIVFASLAYYQSSDVLCPTSILSFIYVSFVQPLVLFKTLQIDSQYWQGLKPGKDNPLAEVWDHVDVETAQSMAEQVERVNKNVDPAHPLPVLHYGLLDFDKGNAFIAGGFSRVYFGTLKRERVAFKILFAMELTPLDVTNFYHEASLLHSLRHPNIVECKGICVMPPALAMVLELCKFGSLFDFLYKPVYERPVVMEEEREESKANESVVSALHSESSGLGNSRPTSIAPLDISTVRASRFRLPSFAVGVPKVRTDSTDSSASMNMSVFKDSTGTSSMASAQDVALQPVAGEGGSRQNSAEGMRQTSVGDGSSSAKRQSLMVKTLGQVSSFLAGTIAGPTQTVVPTGGVSPQKTEMVSAAVGTSIELRLRMMRDAVNAIAFLHSRGFMHCDIKSLNFLVDQHFRVKLADLGEARSVHGPHKHKLPPIPARNWAAPELLDITARAEAYTMKSEVYGVAIVFCELLTLRLPYGDTPDRMMQTEWHSRMVSEDLRPDIDAAAAQSVPSELLELIYKALSIDPLARPSSKDVLALLDMVVAELPPPDVSNEGAV